jgi:hypothetical protein
MNDVQTIGEASCPQREHTALQNNKVHSFTAFLFLRAIFACLDPNPEPADQNPCGSMLIWIHSTQLWRNYCIKYQFIANSSKNWICKQHLWCEDVNTTFIKCKAITDTSLLIFIQMHEKLYRFKSKQTQRYKDYTHKEFEIREPCHYLRSLKLSDTFHILVHKRKGLKN